VDRLARNRIGAVRAFKSLLARGWAAECTYRAHRQQTQSRRILGVTSIISMPSITAAVSKVTISLWNYLARAVAALRRAAKPIPGSLYGSSQLLTPLNVVSHRGPGEETSGVQIVGEMETHHRVRQRSHDQTAAPFGHISGHVAQFGVRRPIFCIKPAR
jgi:hypothetical protein